jgi:hypothetical protein
LARLPSFCSTRPDDPLALELTAELTVILEELGEPFPMVFSDLPPSRSILGLGSFVDVVRGLECALPSGIPAQKAVTTYVGDFELEPLNLVFELGLGGVGGIQTTQSVTLIAPGTKPESWVQRLHPLPGGRGTAGRGRRASRRHWTGYGVRLIIE